MSEPTIAAPTVEQLAAVYSFTDILGQFVATQQAKYLENLKARMPDISAEQQAALFDSCARALEKLEPTLEGKSAREKDAATIRVLEPILGSTILAAGARQFHKLQKLKDAAPHLEAVFDEQLSLLIENRGIPEGELPLVRLHAESLALNSIKGIFPDESKWGPLNLMQEIRHSQQRLAPSLAEHAKPSCPPATDALLAFVSAIVGDARKRAGLDAKPTLSR